MTLGQKHGQLPLYSKQKSKKDNPNGTMGNACTTTQNISLAIEITKITGDLPQTIDFNAIHPSQFSEYNWDFGD